MIAEINSSKPALCTARRNQRVNDHHRFRVLSMRVAHCANVAVHRCSFMHINLEGATESSQPQGISVYSLLQLTSAYAFSLVLC